MLLTKTAKSRFVPPFGGIRGNVHGSFIWLVGKRVVDFLLVLIELFLGWGAMSGHWSKSWFFKRGWVTLSANFRGRGSPTNDCWRQKTRVPVLSRGVVCVILRLAVLIQYRRVIDRHTDIRRRLIPALASRRAGKNPVYLRIFNLICT